MKLNRIGRAGFTLVEIMIVVAIIALLAAIAIPNYVHARTNAQQSGCVNNLRLIDGAKQQWGLEAKVAPTMEPTLDDIKVYLGRSTNGAVPLCPGDNSGTFDTSYKINNLLTPPKCIVSGFTNHVLLN